MSGRDYIVTEFVDGGTLRDWRNQQARSPQDIATLLIEVAEGLAVAHEAGIPHRDIKPGNILVSKSGFPKLADFGLAKAVESPSRAHPERSHALAHRSRHAPEPSWAPSPYVPGAGPRAAARPAQRHLLVR